MKTINRETVTKLSAEQLGECWIKDLQQRDVVGAELQDYRIASTIQLVSSTSFHLMWAESEERDGAIK